MVKQILIILLLIQSVAFCAWTEFVDGTQASAAEVNGNFNYIEENNNIGSAHAIENTTSYNFNEGNSILFRTRQY